MTAHHNDDRVLHCLRRSNLLRLSVLLLLPVMWKLWWLQAQDWGLHPQRAVLRTDHHDSGPHNDLVCIPPKPHEDLWWVPNFSIFFFFFLFAELVLSLVSLQMLTSTLVLGMSSFRSRNPLVMSPISLLSSKAPWETLLVNWISPWMTWSGVLRPSLLNTLAQVEVWLLSSTPPPLVSDSCSFSLMPLILSPRIWYSRSDCFQKSQAPWRSFRVTFVDCVYPKPGKSLFWYDRWIPKCEWHHE